MKALRKEHFLQRISKKISLLRGNKKNALFVLEKRQKFVLAVLFLSLGLFLAEFQFGKSGIYTVLILPVLTDIFLWLIIKEDIKKSTLSVLILPFLYSLAFGFFYFLTPARLSTRLLFTVIYAFGMYSLFLSQNIFVVGAVKTIQLLSGARIVSFVVTLLSYFFLTNITLTFHLQLIPTIALILLYTYLLAYQSIWTYIMQKTITSIPLWVLIITICIGEIATLLWFWPSSSTVIALFLTGIFYTVVGLSHVWFEKRLFRGVLWEYVWIGVAVFFVLILFTPWGK